MYVFLINALSIVITEKIVEGLVASGKKRPSLFEIRHHRRWRKAALFAHTNCGLSANNCNRDR